MSVYAKVNRLTSEILKRKDYTDPARVFDKSLAWLPVTVQDDPVYDTATEKLVNFQTIPDLSDLNVDVSPTAEIVEGRNKVTMTANEKDALVAVPPDIASLVNTPVNAKILSSTDFPADLIARVNARNRLDGDAEI